MKEFNLEAWEAGEKVQTRGGREVKKLRFFDGCNDESKCFSGVVGGNLRLWNINGRFFSSAVHRLDLVMSPVTRIARFYFDDNGVAFGVNLNDPYYDRPFTAAGKKIHTVEVEE